MDDGAMLLLSSLPRRRFGGVDANAVAHLFVEERTRAHAELDQLRQRLAQIERERDEAVAKHQARENEINSVLRIATDVAAQTTVRAQQEAESLRGEARGLHGQLVAFAGAVQEVVLKWAPILQAGPTVPPVSAPAPVVAPPASPPERYSMTLVATPLLSPEQAVEIERTLLGIPAVVEAQLVRLDGGEAHFSIVVTGDIAGSPELAGFGSTLRSGLDRYMLVLGGDQATR